MNDRRPAGPVDGALEGALMAPPDALALAERRDTAALMAEAAGLRDAHHGAVMTYSRKVFIPLTHLCRDACHYCTFAMPPRRGEGAYMSPDEVLAVARAGAAAGCTEALFTLGDKPELRYPAARAALAALGQETTLSYLGAMAALVVKETGLLPHLNPGVMSRDDMAKLRPVAASMGLMLETSSDRLSARGGVHFGSPDKDPAVRLAVIEQAGELGIPFTTGLLIGIGETRRERIEALLALRARNGGGHIQEVIIQPFRAKPGTRMADHPDASDDDLLWTLAVARLVLGGAMNVQTPPNLAPRLLSEAIDAGINDWGGISPVTPDFVNPEAPWPHVDALAAALAARGRVLVQRLPLYPAYVRDRTRWLDAALHTAVIRASDAEGFARADAWSPGQAAVPATALPKPVVPKPVVPKPVVPKPAVGSPRVLLDRIIAKAEGAVPLAQEEIVALFAARGADYDQVCDAADRLRARAVGDTVTYVVNRNINYTNVCSYRCAFCAFSKGKSADHLRGAAYDLDHDEIARRVAEAWARGATEVCLQGGIHPDYTGDTYLAILRTVKAAVPAMHVHAFLAAGSASRRGDARHPGAALPRAPARCRPRHAAGHRGGNPRRRSPRRHLPGQADYGRVARRDRDRPPSRPARPRRPSCSAMWRGRRTGRAISLAVRDVQATHRRLHRIRAAAFRAHGGADLLQRRRAAGTDAARSGADARGGAARAPPAHCATSRCRG